MEELICVTNAFFLDTIRNETNNDTLEMYAMYIDWNYHQSIELPLVLNFSANVTDGEGELVDQGNVIRAMAISLAQIVLYIEQHVWNTTPDDVFYYTESEIFTALMNEIVPVGRLETVACPKVPLPSTMMPTITPTQPSSLAPSSNPTRLQIDSLGGYLVRSAFVVSQLKEGADANDSVSKGLTVP
jgi:hypothetical protein